MAELPFDIAVEIELVARWLPRRLVTLDLSRATGAGRGSCPQHVRACGP
ncbi:MAG: hypothetical protein WAV00_11205 [Nocardioides sp.]